MDCGDVRREVKGTMVAMLVVMSVVVMLIARACEGEIIIIGRMILR